MRGIRHLRRRRTRLPIFFGPPDIASPVESCYFSSLLEPKEIDQVSDQLSSFGSMGHWSLACSVGMGSQSKDDGGTAAG